MGWRSGGPEKVMGAVFPPAPTFPVHIRLPVRAIFFSLGGSGSGLKILRSQHRFPLGFPTKALLLGRSPASLLPKHLCFFEASFAFPSPEGSGSAGLLGKWERLRLSPLPHASSLLALPGASFISILSDVHDLGSGSSLALLSVSGSSALAALGRWALWLSRTTGFCLWITSIVGISIGGFEKRSPAKNRPPSGGGVSHNTHAPHVFFEKLVGVARIELATPAMSTQCSTTELHAHRAPCSGEALPSQARPGAAQAPHQPRERSSAAAAVGCMSYAIRLWAQPAEGRGRCSPCRGRCR